MRKCTGKEKETKQNIQRVHLELSKPNDPSATFQESSGSSKGIVVIEVLTLGNLRMDHSVYLPVVELNIGLGEREFVVESNIRLRERELESAQRLSLCHLISHSVELWKKTNAHWSVSAETLSLSQYLHIDNA
jgi:hypothetical protein